MAPVILIGGGDPIHQALLLYALKARNVTVVTADEIKYKKSVENIKIRSVEYEPLNYQLKPKPRKMGWDQIYRARQKQREIATRHRRRRNKSARRRRKELRKK